MSPAAEKAGKLSQTHGFFHWELEFPSLYYNHDGIKKNNIGVEQNGNSHGGFDIIIGNPPWERLQVSDDDFFAPIYNQETKQSWNVLLSPDKRKFKNKILQNADIKAKYEKFKHDSKMLRQYMSNNYFNQGGGTPELFKLVLEKVFQLLNKNALVGMLYPSALYSDTQSKNLRQILFKQTSIKHIISFINKKSIFKDVHRQFNFCILIAQAGQETTSFEFAYKLENLSDLLDPKILNKTSISMIQNMSGSNLTIPEMNKKDYAIINKLNQFPTLGSNDWNFAATREFDMSNDRRLFKKQISNTRLPLYQGATISQFTNNGPIKIYVEEQEAIERLLSKVYSSNKEYLEKKYYRLAWREVSNSIDYRTVHSTILPPNVFHGHTIWSVRPHILNSAKKYIPQHKLIEISYLCGIFNSIPFDWLARFSVRLHVTKTIMDQMPVPQFETNNAHKTSIAALAGSLISVGNEYKMFRSELDISAITNPADRQIAEAKISAHAAMIYNLRRSDLEHIINDFRVFQQKNPTFFKKMLLEFDQMNDN